MTAENETLITFWENLLLMPEVKEKTFFFEFNGYGYKSQYIGGQHLQPVVTPNIITIRPSEAVVWFDYNVAKIDFPLIGDNRKFHFQPQTLDEKHQWHNGVWNNGGPDLSQVPSKEKQLGIEQSEISEMNERIKQQRELKVCTGCGHRSDKPLPETALACCPDNNYVDLDHYLKESVYGLRKLYIPNQRVILKNVRRLMTKVYNKQTVNMGLVMDVFGYGSTSAGIKCDELGIDPFSNKIE